MTKYRHWVPFLLGRMFRLLYEFNYTPQIRAFITLIPIPRTRVKGKEIRKYEEV